MPKDFFFSYDKSDETHMKNFLLILISVILTSCFSGGKDKVAKCSGDGKFAPVPRECIGALSASLTRFIDEDTLSSVEVGQGNYDSCQILASSVTSNLILTTPARPPTCSCNSGTCSISIFPRANSIGKGSLHFRLHNPNRGYQDYSLLNVIIRDRNDAPTFSRTNFTINTSEDNNSTVPQDRSTTASIHNFNMCDMIGNSLNDIDSVKDVSLEIETPPTAGTLTCNQCNCMEEASACRCSFTFDNPNDNGMPYSTFGIVFRDTSPHPDDASLTTPEATVTVNTTPRNDRPDTRADLNLTGTPINEDPPTPGILTLSPMTDVEDGTTLNYEIADENNCSSAGPCTHTLEALWRDYGVLQSCLNLNSEGDVGNAGNDRTCEFRIYNNVHAPAVSFYYRAVDSDGATGDWVRVTFRISPVNDPPIPFFAFYEINESKTALASDAGPLTFNVPVAVDQDETDLSSPQRPLTNYSFISRGPTGAGFQNCMNNDGDLNCDFVIDNNNGNLNTAVAATAASGMLTVSGASNLTIDALHPGTQGNLITVNLFGEDISANRYKYHPAPADYSSDCLAPAGTYADCRGYFNRMVQVQALDDGMGTNRIMIDVYYQKTNRQTTDTEVQRLINNHPISSRFVRASGATGIAVNLPGDFSMVNLTGGTDATVGFRAEYTVNDGLVNSAVPNGLISIQITPTNDTPVFCRYSSYEEANECGLYGCIGHQGPREKQILPISHTVNRPIYYYDVTTATCYRSTGTAAHHWEIAVNPCLYSTSNSDCNGGDCRAAGPPNGQVIPATHTNTRPVIYQDSRSNVCYRSTGTGIEDWDVTSASLPEIQVNEGEVIRLKRVVFDEGGADSGEDAQRIHISNFTSNNNVLISLLNSQITQRIDRRFFPCAFSLNSCDNNEHCRERETGSSNPTGNVTPTNHTRSDPLYFWANQTDSLSCYQSTGTTTNDWRQIIDNTFTETVNIYNPVANNFSLNTGGRIPIGNAVNSEDDDDTEVVLTPTTTESGSTIISFDLDDGGCQFSINALDCNNGDCSEAAIGFANPSGNITPSRHTNADPIVYVNNLNTCYQSTGTGNTDWQQVDAWPVTTVYFKVTVNPISAVLPAWKNLAASGPHVNKYNEVKSKDSISCPYSKAKCSGGSACTGNFPPGHPPFSIPPVIGDEDYVIYHDTNANECYFWNPNLAYPNRWQKFINHCNITQSEHATECYNGSCLFDRDVTNPTTLRPTGIDHYYAFYDHDLDTLSCYRSFGIHVGQLGEYDGTGKTVLSWEDFVFKGSSNLNGYNIFRRKAYEEFGEFAINKVPLSSALFTYTDNAVNSRNGPVPGTVYYYQVRPIIENRDTWPLGHHRNARIFVPNSNMSFVHRRIINKRMCELMGRDATAIDGGNHNRCAYTGPGDNADGYYDIGQDFHVATFEAGCPYTVETNSCSTSDGNCIADRLPDDTDDGNNGDFFYNRDEGICYWKNTGSATWEALDEGTADILTEYGTGDNNTKEILKSERPPLSRISQTQAVNMCSDDSMRQSDMIPGCAFSLTGCDTADNRCTDTQDPDGGNGNYTAATLGIYFWNATQKRCWRADSTTAGDWFLIGGGGGVAPNQFDMRLPTRKEQIAFSFWDTTIDHVTAIAYEQGLSLDIDNACNSASADGLTHGYSDLEAPPSADLYSLPGTHFSGIRSMATGVEQTKNCQSIFGIRDIIGNVTEWSSDQVTCHTPYNCAFDTTNTDFLVQSATSRINTAGGFSFGHYDGDSNNLEDDWDTDGYPLGPCRDQDNDDICDSFFDSWPIESRLNVAENFIAPLGLPAHADFPYNYENDNAIDAFLPIGSSLGVSGSHLRRDTIEIQSRYIYCPYNQEDSDCGGNDCTTDETGFGTPDVNITPTGHTSSNPVYFFNENNGQCYVSTGTNNTNWRPVGRIYTKNGCGGNDCTNIGMGTNDPTGTVAPANHEATNPIVFFDSISGNLYVSTGTANTDWSRYTNVSSAPEAGVAHGGSYLKGTGAGQFHMEFIDFKSAKSRTDVGFRCVMPIPNVFYTE